MYMGITGVLNIGKVYESIVFEVEDHAKKLVYYRKM